MSSDEARVDSEKTKPIWLEHAPHFCITVGIGFLLAISGAFGTLETPLIVRLAYWIPIMVVGSLIGWVVADNILKIERWTGSAWLAWLAVTASVGLIMAPLIYGLGLAIGWATWGWLNAIVYLLPSLTIAAVMAGIGVFLNQQPQLTHAMEKQPDLQGQENLNLTPVVARQHPKFLDRLPASLYGADLIAIEAQDHYLKVYSSRGNEMILLRLADALDELHGIEGARVHRSWWVARNSLVSADRGNGKATLTLKGDLKVPVSRSYARALREDKWF
jgi:hypothetical protein